MNTTRFQPSISRRLGAFCLAAVMTVAMLGGVERLATSDAPAGLVAKMAAAEARA
jgi:hypothetical protein